MRRGHALRVLPYENCKFNSDFCETINACELQLLIPFEVKLVNAL